MKKFIPGVIPCVFGFFLLTFGLSWVSCSNISREDKPEDAQAGYHHRFDSVDHITWRLYISDPDSAAKLLIYSAGIADSINDPFRKVYIWLHLCELYQYRKPDFQKSLEAIGTAVRLLVTNPGTYISNPYMYIDIGNVFFRFRFFRESMSFYRIALHFSQKQNYWHGKALARQNLALSYSELDMTDSALYHLGLADKDITDRTNLMLAQNQEYMAEILLKMNRAEETNRLLSGSFHIMLTNNHPPDITNSYEIPEKIHTTWCEIMSRLYKCQADYFDGKDDPDRKRICLDSAVYYARKASSIQLLAQLYFIKALNSGRFKLRQHFVTDLDSASHYIGKINDFDLHRSFADSMVLLCRLNGMNNEADKFRKEALSEADSLVRQHASYGLISNMMQLATVATTQSLQRMQMQENSRLYLIRVQRQALIFLVVFIVVISVFLFILLKQKKEIKLAYRAMVARIQTLNRVQDEINEKKNRKPEMTDFSSKLLIQVMITEKPFLNKELTLQDLAAIVKTNQTYLSQYLNTALGTDFSQFINGYRVNEACRLLALPENQNLTIDTLAGMAGFNTKSTFYAAFKKVTGMTPTAYLKMNRQQAEREVEKE